MTCETCGYWVMYDPQQSGRVGECMLPISLGKASPMKMVGGMAILTAFDFQCNRWRRQAEFVERCQASG